VGPPASDRRRLGRCGVTLARRLARLEALATPTPAPLVWIEDVDVPGTLVSTTTGERLPVAEAGRLGRSDIAVVYVRDWRGHVAES